MSAQGRDEKRESGWREAGGRPRMSERAPADQSAEVKRDVGGWERMLSGSG